MANDSGFHHIVSFSLEEEEKILQERYRSGKRMKKNRDIKSSGVLNINSMMDLMTIILVFLIMTAKSQTIQPEMSDELFMPWSTAFDAVEDTMTITITEQAVLVNNSYVVDVRDGDIPEGNRVSASSPIIPQLQAAVEDVLHVEERWDIIRQEVQERVATVIADDDTTYQVLTYVMMTASAAGVQNFKFAILHHEPNQLFDSGT
jgi:biopolymer transport protein ExbD